MPSSRSALARAALGGLPVPPAAAVKAGTRMRRWLFRAEAGSTVPFQLLLERLWGHFDARLLHAVVVLGVPDALASDGPQSVGALASAVGADEDALGRVLRYLSSRGFFKQRRDGRWANSRASSALVSGGAGNPFSWRDWALFQGAEWNSRIWDSIGVRLRAGGGSAVEAALGTDLFTFLTEVDPSAGSAFNGSMAAGTRVQGAVFAARAPGLSSVSTVCDVGGGTGSVVAALLSAWPSMRGTVFDLPALEEGAAEVLAPYGERASFTGGDFFAEGSIPSGCDLYTLFSIVHDWGDDDVVRILSAVRSAAGNDGRVMVVEAVLDGGPAGAFAMASDMLMLAYTTGGRERTQAEFEALFAAAGLRLADQTLLPSLFTVFTLAAMG